MDVFSNINYPVFGWKTKPFSVREDSGKLFVKKTPKAKEMLLDNKGLKGETYLERSFHIPFDWKFSFCENIDELIFNDLSWGMDKYGEIIKVRPSRDRKYKDHLFKKEVPVESVSSNGVRVKGIYEPYPIYLTGVSSENLYCDLMTAQGKFRILRFYNKDINNEKVY